MIENPEQETIDKTPLYPQESIEEGEPLRLRKRVKVIGLFTTAYLGLLYIFTKNPVGESAAFTTLLITLIGKMEES